MDEKDEIKQDVSEEQENSQSTPEDVSVENPELAADAEGASDISDEVASENETPESSDNMPDAGIDSPDPKGEPDANLAEPLAQDDVDKALEQSAQVSDEFGVGEDVTDNNPAIKQADFQQLSSSSDDSEPKNIELLMDVDLPVSIELGRTKMRISDILNLAPGSIVELDKLVGEPVDLLVNRKCVARGEVVVVEESFGLRITQLVSPEERLGNL